MNILLRIVLSMLFIHTSCLYSALYQKPKQEAPDSSIWKQLSEGKTLTREDKIKAFIHDTTNNKHQNAFIPQHGPQTVRIATYNVHYWADPFNKPNFTNIINTIKAINSDILVLQEVSMGVTQFNQLDAAKIQQVFTSLGYKYMHFCKATNLFGAPFGNLIASKYPLNNTSSKIFNANEKEHGEERCYIKAEIVLPNKKSIIVYGTHLDVFDETEAIRWQQAQEILEQVKIDTNPNVVIMADFNAARERDYMYTLNNKKVWSLVIQDYKARNINWVSTHALDTIAQNGFRDSFTRAGAQAPKFTVWSGMVVDFIFVKNSFNLPIVGSYVYFDAATDHLPIIMDIQV